MALKSKNPMDSLIARGVSKTNPSQANASRDEKRQADLEEELIERRVRQLMTKKNRKLQRSLKIDKRMADWLDNVKKYQRDVEGIPRPCIDDLMYDAIAEYLENHFKDMEP